MNKENRRIHQMLVSVSDKTGVVEFVKPLQVEFNIKVLSTGGTADLLRKGGVVCTDVSDYTGFPEMMNGRVKTLHPKVHGGLLCIRGNENHMAAAMQHDIRMIDMVVVNLYPFEKTIAKPNVTLDEAIENIDIGGPSMLRSAAKNLESVAPVSDPRDYAGILKEMRENDGALSFATRFYLAALAFQKTQSYDAAIALWFAMKRAQYCRDK